MTTLPEYVALLRSMQGDGGFYSFIEKYATLREGSPLPEGMQRGKLGLCYMNALHLSQRVDGLVYCEGLATNARFGVPMEHAWCLHLDSGRVIDNTWDTPEGSHYYGVPFERAFVSAFVLRTGVYGLMGWESDPSASLYTRGVRVDERGIVTAFADEKAARV